ncbi:MAG: hypothetical protein JXR19_09540 [Bacteroidia bacterium]
MQSRSWKKSHSALKSSSKTSALTQKKIEHKVAELRAIAVGKPALYQKDCAELSKIEWKKIKPLRIINTSPQFTAKADYHRPFQKETPDPILTPLDVSLFLILISFLIGVAYSPLGLIILLTGVFLFTTTAANSDFNYHPNTIRGFFLTFAAPGVFMLILGIGEITGLFILTYVAFIATAIVLLLAYNLYMQAIPEYNSNEQYRGRMVNQIMLTITIGMLVVLSYLAFSGFFF